MVNMFQEFYHPTATENLVQFYNSFSGQVYVVIIFILHLRMLAQKSLLAKVRQLNLAEMRSEL